MNRIIFYHPHQIVKNPRKGSELRPKKMKEAFENIGYKVDLAVGDAKKRKIAFNRIRKSIEEGKEYDFMYSESSNMPIPISGTNHLPIRPLQDYFFFRMLNKKSIPIGFFYRDIYWRDKAVHQELAFYKYYFKQFFHWMEWLGIKETVDYLFLPTRLMAKYLPHKWPKERLKALYPGCLLDQHTNDLKSSDKKLTLFYVGGIKPPLYDLKPMIRLLSEINGAKLILCCRKKEWEDYSHLYGGLDFSNIEIVHADSNEIREYYRKADVFLDTRKPEGYLKTTIPIKIFEALGYNVPLMLLDGTEYAEFVKKEGAGWVVKDIAEAKELLVEFIDDRSEIVEKAKNLKKISKNHTWEKRAEQAAETLIKPV